MASTYNPYSDIKSIYDLKGQWDEANKAGDTNKTKQIAATAQAYYDKLKNNNYGGVAQALSASGYQDAKAILDSYAPKTTAPDSTSLTNSELITTNNNETRNKINSLWGTQTSDREMMTGKYNKLEETAYSNPFTTDEAKAILAKYDLAGLQGRDNAVASGGASNGGNIDSYSAANAMRQQAALVNQGQMAVLDAHNNRINNVQNTLSNLGVYLQNQDKGMQTTIGLQANEGQRLFENEETAKNNDVARKSEIASVTGYVPTEWTYDNNIYLNSDGTVRAEYLTDEFDNTGGFTTIINNAKAKLATTTDATERANLQATINAATQAKALKTFSSPKYSKYAHEVQGTAGTPTLEKYTTDLNADTALKTLGIESDLSKYGIDAESKSKLDQINAEKDAQKELLEYETLLKQAATGEITDDMMKPVVADINSTYKDVVDGDLIVKVGNKYTVKNNYGGAVARYLMSNILGGDAEATAKWMKALFDIPEQYTAVALSKSKVYNWEVDYNPANY